MYIYIYIYTYTYMYIYMYNSVMAVTAYMEKIDPFFGC